MSEHQLPIAKCDFCMVGDPDPAFVVVSEPFLMPEQRVMTTGEWAACSDCLRELGTSDFDGVFKRWMTNAGSTAVAAALLRGEKVLVAEWHNALDQLWRTAWSRRTEVRAATTGDRLEMVTNLELFRQTHPDRVLP